MSLITNLALVNQIALFDVELFEAPVALLEYLSYTFFTESALICCRLWKDHPKNTLTLDRFAKWLLETAIKKQYREELRCRLQAASISPDIEAIIDSLRELRHARLAHLDHQVISGLATAPQEVSLRSVELAANALGRYFNAMCFSREQMFVLIQFYSHSGAWYEGELGYVLDLIALESKWLTGVDEYPHMLALWRKELTTDQLRTINSVRARHNKPPLV